MHEILRVSFVRTRKQAKYYTRKTYHDFISKGLFFRFFSSGSSRTSSRKRCSRKDKPSFHHHHHFVFFFVVVVVVVVVKEDYKYVSKIEKESISNQQNEFTYFTYHGVKIEKDLPCIFGTNSAVTSAEFGIGGHFQRCVLPRHRSLSFYILKYYYTGRCVPVSIIHCNSNYSYKYQ